MVSGEPGKNFKVAARFASSLRSEAGDSFTGETLALKLAFRGNFDKLAGLKKFPGQIFGRGRFLLAIVAGLLLAASFPKLSFAGLAWIAPALLLGAAREKTGWSAFRIGYVGGLAYYLASLYWLLLIPESGFYPALGWVASGPPIVRF